MRRRKKEAKWMEHQAIFNGAASQGKHQQIISSFEWFVVYCRGGWLFFSLSLLLFNGAASSSLFNKRKTSHSSQLFLSIKWKLIEWKEELWNEIKQINLAAPSLCWICGLWAGGSSAANEFRSIDFMKSTLLHHSWPSCFSWRERDWFNGIKLIKERVKGEVKLVGGCSAWRQTHNPLFRNLKSEALQWRKQAALGAKPTNSLHQNKN